MPSLTETLTKTALFGGMATEDVDSVAALTVIRQFPKNTLVVSQGDYH